MKKRILLAIATVIVVFLVSCTGASSEQTLSADSVVKADSTAQLDSTTQVDSIAK